MNLSANQQDEKIKILGYYYDMVEDGDYDSTGAFGRMNPKIHKIQIASDLCQQEKETTVLHEIIESINYHLELKLEHPVIMSLEASLYQALTDNGVSLAPLTRFIKPK
jgi:hypothetical protein